MDVHRDVDEVFMKADTLDGQRGAVGGRTAEALAQACAADAVVVLDVPRESQTLRVLAVAGDRDAAQEISQQPVRLALQRVARGAGPLDLGVGRLQPIVHEEAVLGVIAVLWTGRRPPLPTRIDRQARFAAAEASLALTGLDREESIQLRRALELHDSVVQELVLARYALEQGRSEEGERRVEEALRRARGLVGRELGALAGEDGKIRPGDLVLRGDPPVG